MRIRQLHDGKAVQGRRQVGQTQFNGTDIGHANGLPGSPDAKNKGQRAHPRFQRRQGKRKRPGHSETAATDPQNQHERVFQKQHEKKEDHRGIERFHQQKHGVRKRRREKGSPHILVNDIFQADEQKRRGGNSLCPQAVWRKENEACRDVQKHRYRNRNEHHAVSSPFKNGAAGVFRTIGNFSPPTPSAGE